MGTHEPLCRRICCELTSLCHSELSGAGLKQHASAAEPDQTGAAEASKTPAQPIPNDAICSALVAAAVQNDLPTSFFIRLIWHESRFDPAAVSRAGAQGVAQFMPPTATWRGLSNPFDALEAIAHSAKLLRDLRREFGSPGLAAAAYNAGSGRVHDWLASRRTLPEETRAYVRRVTGYSAEQWVEGSASIGEAEYLTQSSTRAPIPGLASPGYRAPADGKARDQH